METIHPRPNHHNQHRPLTKTHQRTKFLMDESSSKMQNLFKRGQKNFRGKNEATRMYAKQKEGKKEGIRSLLCDKLVWKIAVRMEHRTCILPMKETGISKTQKNRSF